MDKNRYAFSLLSKLTRGSLAGFATMLLIMAGFTTSAFAQRTVEVDQGVGTLNMAIDGDTTDTGARVDSNTVYVLQKDGIYLLNGSIENRFPLTIVAADGEGARPVIRPGNVDGGSSSRPFRPRGDLHVRGVYVTNILMANCSPTQHGICCLI